MPFPASRSNSGSKASSSAGAASCGGRSSPVPGDEKQQDVHFQHDVPSTPKTPSRLTPNRAFAFGKSISSGKTPPRMIRGASSVLHKVMDSTPGSKKKSSAATASVPPAMPPKSSEKSMNNEEPVHSGNTLENYVLPMNLRMGTVDVNQAQGGMEVIKVSKVNMR